MTRKLGISGMKESQPAQNSNSGIVVEGLLAAVCFNTCEEVCNAE